MMFSLFSSLISVRNALTKANIHLLYTRIVLVHPGTNSYSSNRDRTNMEDLNRVLSYDDMLKVINVPRKVIIDVREPDEVESTGKIPSSINIPLSSVSDLKTMSQEDFRRQFRRDKPTSDDELIFYCRSGRRSTEALDKALKMGYKNSKNYLGSWTEWSSKKR